TWSLATHEGRARGTAIGVSVRVREERSLQDLLAVAAGIRVPVRLGVIDGEALLSRSQARRLIRRLEKEPDVVLDFAGVESIGPKFADELSETAFRSVNAAPAVERALRGIQPERLRTAT